MDMVLFNGMVRALLLFQAVQCNRVKHREAAKALPKSAV